MRDDEDRISRLFAALRRALLPGAMVAALCIIPFIRNEAVAQAQAGSSGYAVTIFGGAMNSGNIEDILSLQHVRYRDANLVGLGVSKRFGGLWDVIDFEIEGQVDRHFGREHHWEFNLPVIARWKAFPWNAYVPTSFAFGVGPSYATQKPAQERAQNGGTQRFLIYWVAELEMGLPDEPWSVLTRLHHRSTAFGLSGRTGGSTWTLVGLRRRF